MSKQAKTRDEMLLRCSNFQHFAEDAYIRTTSGKVRFGNIMAPFQREVIATIAPALLAIARGDEPPTPRVWQEMTKGSGKDLILGMAVCWLAMFGAVPLHIQIAAVDRDNADDLRRTIRGLMWANAWWKTHVEVQNYKIIRKLSGDAPPVEAEILACDAAGSHGARPSLLILNELHAVTDWEFINGLLNNADKLAGMVWVCTNAGVIGSNCYKLREIARTSPRWAFFQYTSPAPWISADALEEARRRMPPSVFARWWLGEWVSANGDALPQELIEDAIVLDGPMTSPERDWVFIGGLDAAVRRDHCGFVIVGAKAGYPRIRVVNTWTWKPPKGGEIDLTQVENTVLHAARRYQLQSIYYDFSQTAGMIQRLRRCGYTCIEQRFSGEPANIMAVALMTAFRDRLIELYPCEQLIKDLGRLIIEEKGNNQYRITAVSNAEGHADTAIALCCAIAPGLRLIDSVSGGFFGPLTTKLSAATDGRRGVHLHRPSTCRTIRPGVPFDRAGNNGWQRVEQPRFE